MKSYALVLAGFVLGVGLSSIYFLSSQPDKTPSAPVAGSKTTAVDSCVVSKEILPPPKFSERLPEKLETNREAEVRVSWEAVPGAKSYNIYVTNKAGRLVRRYGTTHTTIYLKEIPTPKDTDQIDYKIFLTTVNANNEDGEKSEGRDLRVNKQASVVAPTVKQIVVED